VPLVAELSALLYCVEQSGFQEVKRRLVILG
jgi:hypothetical protein